MTRKKIFIFIALSLLLSMFAIADNAKIRVGLNFGKTAVKDSTDIVFENGFQTGLVDQDGVFLPTMFYADTNVTVKASNGSIKLVSGGSVIFEGASGAAVYVCPLSSELDSNGNIPHTRIGSIIYPDILEFSASGNLITIVNIVDSELYLKGVLPSEVYPSWHEEALKAAAVATRTYSYRNIGGKHSSYGIDLCSTTCCQVYSGITKCQNSTNNAVDATRNQVLTYGGSLITAVYHAISGGVTESAAGAWGGNPESYPYLTVVETPFENYEEIARGHWTKMLYDEDFASLIAASGNSSKISAPIASITVNDYTPGYLNNMTITDAAGNSIFLPTSGNIRSFFSTQSANFTIEKVFVPHDYAADSALILTADGLTSYSSGEYAAILTAEGKETVGGIRRGFRINGRGYGHGVGLSQYGAQYAAKAGYFYNEILSIYYPGAVIVDYAAMQ